MKLMCTYTTHNYNLEQSIQIALITKVHTIVDIFYEPKPRTHYTHTHDVTKAVIANLSYTLCRSILAPIQTIVL